MNVGPREVDSWLFPVRGLAQRRLARDWLEIHGANENAAGAGDPFFREAVSTHRPVFRKAGGSPVPPFPFLRHARRAEKNKRPISVERELEPTPFSAPRNSGGIAAPEGHRFKVSGVCRVSARSPPSRRSRVAQLNPSFSGGLCTAGFRAPLETVYTFNMCAFVNSRTIDPGP